MSRKHLTETASVLHWLLVEADVGGDNSALLIIVSVLI